MRYAYTVDLCSVQCICHYYLVCWGRYVSGSGGMAVAYAPQFASQGMSSGFASHHDGVALPYVHAVSTETGSEQEIRPAASFS